MIDILEHQAYCDSVREGFAEGFNFDDTMAAGESDCDDDPFSNGYLTEDEMFFPEGYEPRDYLPNTKKKQMYFLYTQKGWDVKRLSQHFGVRTERVSAIINLKATEQEMIDTGRYREEVDSLMTQMYAGQHDYNDAEPSTDQGLHVAVLKDDQDPDDVLPQDPTALRGRILRLPHSLPHVPQPPRSERVFKSKYAIKDISGNPGKGHRCLLVDYDGSVRQSTPEEDKYRTWEVKYWVPRKGASAGAPGAATNNKRR